MNVKRISVISLLAVVVLFSTTQAFATVEYMETPAGVMVPVPQLRAANIASEHMPRCNLLGGLLSTVEGITTGVSNLLPAQMKAQQAQQQQTHYIEYPNASGVVVRVPAR